MFFSGIDRDRRLDPPVQEIQIRVGSSLIEYNLFAYDSKTWTRLCKVLYVCQQVRLFVEETKVRVSGYICYISCKRELALGCWRQVREQTLYHCLLTYRDECPPQAVLSKYIEANRFFTMGSFKFG